MTGVLTQADLEQGPDHSAGVNVLVTSGACRERLPAAGYSVGVVKSSLRDAWGIPFYCQPVVNDVAVGLTTVLRPGDRLHFRFLKGIKAAEDAGPTEAERLLSEFPGLRAIAAGVKALGLDSDRSIEAAVVLTWRFFVEQFGPLPERERDVLAGVVWANLPRFGVLSAGQETDPLTRIEQKIDQLLRACLTKKWYTTEEVAAKYGKDVYTVREWCRLKRVDAKKVKAGRGSEQEWRISHQELLRFEEQGLRPLPAGSR